MLSASEFRALADTYKEMHASGRVGKEDFEKLMASLVERQTAPIPATQGSGPHGDAYDVSSMWDLENLSRNKTLRAQNPWADRYVLLAKEHERILASFAEKDHEERAREVAIDRAKNGLLSTVDLFILTHLLFSDDIAEGAWTLVEMVLNTPSKNLVALHNWIQLAGYTDAQRAMIAGEALACPEPLFPPKYLRGLNDVLLRSTTEQLQGGGIARLFRPLDESDLLGGGYYAPILGPDGTQQAAVDLTQMADFIAKECSASREEAKLLESLVRKMTKQKASTPTPNAARRKQGYSYGNQNAPPSQNRGTPSRNAQAPVGQPERPTGRALPPHDALAECKKPAHEVFWGGDIRSGTTSSVELDALYRRFLPSGSTLLCRTLPDLVPAHMKDPLSQPAVRALRDTILSRLKARGKLYFPLFTRRHWIAGILRDSPTGPTLDVYDSAPSWPVNKDIRKAFRLVFPEVRVVFRLCAKQKRDSLDCGIFMSATFFADHIGVSPTITECLPSRLRKFFYEASLAAPSKETFLREFRKEIQVDPKPVPPNTEHNRLVAGQSKKAVGMQTATSPSGPAVSGGAAPGDDVLEAAAAEEESVARVGMGFMLCAVALLSAADGRWRGLGANALRTRAHRLGLQAGSTATVTQALRALGATVYQCGNNPNGTGHFVNADSVTFPAALFLEPAENVTLPQQFMGRTFVAGARRDDERRDYRGVVNHVTLTRDPQAAVVGLYMPDTVPEENPRRHPIPPRTARDDAIEADAEAEMREALHTGVSDRLNGPGRRQLGHACPRDWYIYQDKPPQVSQLAWTAMSPEVRKQHQHWLHNLRAMPGDLITLPLPSAAIELVRRMGRARQWRWSTMARHFASVKAALLQLPLYTNQTEPINLDEYPEWRYATAAARRFERETPARPPEPISLEEYRAARDLLRGSPEALLYLAMMWSFAARAGDIGMLATRDIHVEYQEGDQLTHLSLTIRRGKGARFRGPYPISSSLERDDAALLERIASRRLPNQNLFSNLTGLKAQVRAALKRINARAALPSLRKGACIHLADRGVPEADIMRLTGHRRTDTFRRYLGYGRHPTVEDEMQQENVARALHERT